MSERGGRAVTYGEGEMTAMDDMTKETDAGIGHNQPLDPDGERGLEAIRDYDASVAKEQASRDDAISAAARYGAVLIAGRAKCNSNNEFGDWIVSQGLDRHRIFCLRQERQAAIQIAEIVAHVAAETVDSTTAVNPFDRCPNNRPTHIMAWWRERHPNLLTMEHAKTVGERAAKILRDHRDNSAITNETSIVNLERLERDPFAALMNYRKHEDIIERLQIALGMRAPPAQPAPKTSAAAPAAPKAATAEPRGPGGRRPRRGHNAQKGAAGGATQARPDGDVSR
jgi:hypothetical protein